MPSGRSQSAVLRPLTLVASTILSRPPRAASQLPTMRSVEPCVSALGGIEYISAVSRKLIPASTARSIWAWPSASVFCWPKVIVPRQIEDTAIPVRPSLRISIIARPSPCRCAGPYRIAAPVTMWRRETGPVTRRRNAP